MSTLDEITKEKQRVSEALAGPVRRTARSSYPGHATVVGRLWAAWSRPKQTT